MKKIFSFIAIFGLIFAFVGCTEKTTTTATTTTTSEEPVGVLTWGGLTDKTIVRGDVVDLLEGVTVSDSIDGNITEDIEITDDDGFTSSLAGGYVVTYSVTNSTGVTETKTKNFTVAISHNVANGDFAIDGYAWNLDVPGGAATLDYVDGKAEISITNSGNSWWGIQLNQQNMIFTEGVTYKLSLKASSTTGHSLSAGFEDVVGGYAMLNPGFQTMELDETTQTYSIYYTAAADYTNVKVVVYLGSQLPTDAVGETPHEVVIDDIYVEVVQATQNVTFSGVDEVDAFSGEVNFNALTGVTAVDDQSNDVTADIEVVGMVPNEILVPSTYYVTYMVTLDDGSFSFYNRKVNIALAKDFEYQPVNGEFDNGLTGWTQDVNQTNGTGAATFTANGDGTVSILVTNASDAGWHIQLQQASSTFRSGETYVVTITLKASAARKVTIEIVDPSNGFAQIAPTLNAVEVGTDWVTYEVEFTADKDYTNAKIGLLLGDVDGMTPENITVTVDKFTVYKYDAYNEEFATTNEPWNYDHISGEIVDGQVVVTFVANGETGWVVGNDPWNNQLYQSSGSELVAGHTYKIEVYLKSSIARTIRVWIEDVNKGYAGIATDAKTEITLVADTWTLLTYEVTITAENATTNAKFVVMFGDSAAKDLAQVITIDYFRITDTLNIVE